MQTVQEVAKPIANRGLSIVEVAYVSGMSKTLLQGYRKSCS